VKEKGLTYLSYKKLLFLEEALREVERSGCPGDVVEAGVARGGAGTVLAKGMSERRRYWGYDSFESMPEPSEEDGHKAHERYNEIISEEARGLEGKNYYGYENELLNIVSSNFADFGFATDDNRVNLIPGYFEDTFDMEDDTQLALVHVDCDWYKSVSLVLDRVRESISEGGVIVIDDYNDYEGARRATKEFIGMSSSFYIKQSEPSAILHKRKQEK